VGFERFDAERHFLLSASREEMYDEASDRSSFRTRSGFPTDFPDALRGISGCSVWKLGSLKERPVRWRQPRLVGIETAVYTRAQAIRATKWNSVTTLLHAAFPDLRPVLKFYVDTYNLKARAFSCPLQLTLWARCVAAAATSHWRRSVRPSDNCPSAKRRRRVFTGGTHIGFRQ
jgi:hypothetical protein